MPISNIMVLLVEDSPTDADLLQDGLTEANIGSFEVVHVTSLADAKQQLNSKVSFDAVLLDLGLPDSQGLETLSKALEHSGDIPVIVLTGLDDDEMGAEAMRLGANDYLVKGEGGNGRHNFITRSICFALERHNLLIESIATKAKDHHDKQISELSDLGIASDEEPLALSERNANNFAGLVSSYGDILNSIIQARTEPSDFDMRASLKKLADEMGELKAGPQDVVEIHSMTLKAIAKTCGPQEISTLIEEGHVTSLGLMGMLVSYYRKYT